MYASVPQKVLVITAAGLDPSDSMTVPSAPRVTRPAAVTTPVCDGEGEGAAGGTEGRGGGATEEAGVPSESGTLRRTTNLQI